MKIMYPPVKYNINPVPEKLIYKRLILNKYHDFTLCSTSKPYKIAILTCVESKRYLKNKSEPSLFIHLLKCSPQKEGLGTEMLNFAVKYSKKLGLKGNLHCIASTELSPNEVPHPFYKKFGFNTEDAELNNQLDNFIKSGQKATNKDFNNVPMYYPAVEDFYPKKPKPKSLWHKLKSLFIPST